MSFPTSVSKASPANTDNPSAGAAQIRNLKTFLEDVFGIQDATSYSAAAFSLGTAGQVTVSQSRLLFQNGDSTTPAFAFAGATGTGLAYDGATTAMAILRNGAKVGYLGIPTTPDMGGTGQDFSASSGVLTFNPAGVATVVEPPWIGVNTFRLVYLAGNLTLAKVNGNIIDINGIVYGITSIPVLAGTGAEADHWYYIYLCCAGGTPTLSFSETVPIADSVGRMYKTGDGSYRLMGVSYALVADTWSADPLVTTSYDNRKLRTNTRAFTTARSTSAAVWAEINSEIRMPIVAFEGDAIMSTITGNHYGDNATNVVDGYVGLGTDGVVTVSTGYDKKKIIQLARSTFAISNVDTIVTDGFHYLTVVGGTDPAATQNEIMDASTTLRVSTWG